MKLFGTSKPNHYPFSPSTVFSSPAAPCQNFSLFVSQISKSLARRKLRVKKRKPDTIVLTTSITVEAVNYKSKYNATTGGKYNTLEKNMGRNLNHSP